MQRLSSRPEPFYVAYVNPLHAEAVSSQPGAEIVAKDDWCTIWRFRRGAAATTAQPTATDFGGKRVAAMNPKPSSSSGSAQRRHGTPSQRRASESGNRKRSLPRSRNLPSAASSSPPFPATRSGASTPPPISPIGIAQRDSGVPGEPPYTRGIHPAMYRARLWTMRQFAGFGSARDTNARFRYLLSQGQTGLSVAFDLPTLMGYDSDHPLCGGRSRQMRRGHQFAGRHGSALRPDSAGRASPRR